MFFLHCRRGARTGGRSRSPREPGWEHSFSSLCVRHVSVGLRVLPCGLSHGAVGRTTVSFFFGAQRVWSSQLPTVCKPAHFALILPFVAVLRGDLTRARVHNLMVRELLCWHFGTTFVVTDDVLNRVVWGVLHD